MHLRGGGALHRLRQPTDARTYAALLRSLARSPCPSPLRRLRQIHAHLALLGILHDDDAPLAARLASAYARSDDFPSASLLLHHADRPSTLLFNALLRSHSLRGSPLEILCLFRRMLALGLPPDHFTFPFALKAASDLSFLYLGRTLHLYTLRRGLHRDAYVGSSLINMYAKCGDLDDAHRMFNETALRLPSSWNALIAGYMRVGAFGAAENLFDEMPERNIISWTSMISGYCQSGLSGRALSLFHEMRQRDSEVKPNWVTVVSVLPACAHSTALEQGERIHQYAAAMGFDSHPIVQIALVGMYSKCGNLTKARQLFDKIPHGDKDVTAWNSMITSYASHGLGCEAVSTFEGMLRSGIRPDPITFTGLLSGCSHSGLIDQGLAYFDSMKTVYHVKPQSEHYACVVDLYSRAGRLVEAMRMIERMETEAGASVWGALLSACRNHGNVELAEVAASKLFEIEPENSANYALLWNMYSELGRWDEVKRVKALMREKGTKKNPGFSWTETSAKVCAPQTTDVYMSS
ncbi:pentatricopeptide repeat-containing protein At5g08510-like [Zingiber officinale]|nr:pentatricopeptide repeat-containing protein At5g08510-like [Zingiber officinale]